jgi:hypothetical protein
LIQYKASATLPIGPESNLIRFLAFTSCACKSLCALIHHVQNEQYTQGSDGEHRRGRGFPNEHCAGHSEQPLDSLPQQVLGAIHVPDIAHKLQAGTRHHRYICLERSKSEYIYRSNVTK